MLKIKHFKQDLKLYWRIATYIKPYLWVFVAALLGSAAYSGLDATVTYLFKPLLDEGFVEKNVDFVRWVPIAVIGAFILRGIANFVSTYGMSWVTRTVVMVMRQQMFQHFLRLPSRYYDQNTSGQLLSKLLYNVEQVARISTDVITDLVQSVCLILGLIIVMFSISWRLALLYLLTAPLAMVIIRYSSRRIRRVSRDVQQTMEDVTEIAEESIEGCPIVKTFGGEAYETIKFNHASRQNRQREMKVVTTRTLSVFAVQFISALGVSVVIYLAILPGSAWHLSAGGFVSMLIAMLALLRPLKVITKVNSTIQRGLAGAQSVFDLLDEAPEQDTGQIHLTRARGAIRYDNVSFRYIDETAPVLQSATFSIQAGQTVAFVGRSGSGKTTVVSLLARFYEASSGQIYIDDIPIHELTLVDLRRQLALVSQNVTLFNDTIARNIAYGAPEGITQEAIIAAARAAHAEEFICDLPQGFATVVGENGVLLSGGQRQRIAIARAILKNAPILILDEATSALDTESERAIQAALEAVMKNRTTLVIAHRLSTIENADTIMVLDQGRIVEMGSHQELFAHSGHYARLHAMQFKSDSTVKSE